jgi:hypothetical protein
MLWWWDDYVAPLDLYPLFQGPAQVAGQVSWNSKNFTMASVNVRYDAYERSIRTRQLILYFLKRFVCGEVPSRCGFESGGRESVAPLLPKH